MMTAPVSFHRSTPLTILSLPSSLLSWATSSAGNSYGACLGLVEGMIVKRGADLLSSYLQSPRRVCYQDSRPQSSACCPQNGQPHLPDNNTVMQKAVTPSLKPFTRCPNLEKFGTESSTTQVCKQRKSSCLLSTITLYLNTSMVSDFVCVRSSPLVPRF